MHKILQNSGWLLIDKLARLFFGLITMAMIARYIGPVEFGIWNYSIALTAIIGGIAVLGLDKIVVKELVAAPERRDEIISTALFMRVVAGILSCTICIGITWFTRQNNPLYIWCTSITALNILLQSFDVFDYYYQAHNQVQRVIIPKVTVFILFCLIRIACVRMNLSFMVILWVSLAELLITYLLIFAYYSWHEGITSVFKIRMQEARYLFSQSWPLLFTGVLVLLYMKSDQLMLDILTTPQQLGEYAAAARISELWYAIPTVIAVAILPNLIRKRQTNHDRYLENVEKWIRLSMWGSTTIAVVMTIASGRLTGLLYGSQYPHAGIILSIHIWANIPVFLCVAIMQYQIVEGNYNANLYATITGIAANLIINLLLIPSLGGIAAAIATVISYTTVATCLIMVDKTGQGKMFMIKMLNPGKALADIWQLQLALKSSIENLLSVLRQKSLSK
ncbi:flippase [Chitinophaga sancti]|uniref:flippase n=1 Tax=Chitinophaga sancti TaxID=1004 RepID=UPI003F7A8961